MKTTTLPSFLTTPNPEIYLSDNYVVLDFETTNKNKGSALDPDNNLVLSVWKQAGGSFLHSWGNEFQQEELVEAVEQADFLVAQNAKFELQWLARCGLDLHNVLVYDTMIGEYVRGGNRWKYSALSLDSLGERYGYGTKGSLVSSLIKNGVCPSEIPKDWLHTYCKRDVYLTEQVFKRQRSVLHDRGQLPIQFTRCLLTPCLADIESNGMQLDDAKVQKEYTEQSELSEDLDRRLNGISGGINWSSPTQVAGFLYDELGFDEVKNRQGKPIRTATGRKKADVATLAALRPRNAKQRNFLALYKQARNASTQLTKYLTKFKECCEESGGHMEAAFNQTNTNTHRLSSSGARYKTQFQNLPRAYKHIFKARHKGWKVGEADGSQLEFRVAVHLGQDKQGLVDILDGVDVHSFSADIIGVPRQEAKAHTFKPLYGGTSGTKKEKEYYRFFQERYCDITGTQRKWIDRVLNDKKLRTEWGLEYHWPNTKMDSSGYISNTTAICNYPVQGFATAEIIPIAVVYFWHRSKDLQMFLVNTIHDSIISELPPEEQEQFEDLSRQCLIDDVYFYLSEVYGIDFTVPLGCETKVGDYWSLGKEKKFEAARELYQIPVV
jgi:DNA polymerase I-like protein with 3'-5' exonuclease and polymerase domains